jgi:RNA polymerase sigma factor (sigma-70 family)
MSDAQAAVTAVWRNESARMVAALTRMTHDVGLAEDLTQDALVAALDQWPREGVPSNAGAWLMAVAKRRAIDTFRRERVARRGTEALGQDLVDRDERQLADAVDHIEDDVLRLIFLTCHPALPPESRAALTLRLVGGLSTAEIANGFLVAEKTMGQRISRAKSTLTRVRAAFEVPAGEEREERLADVMAVIYLIFSEGYAATAGDHWMRPELCLEALRLVRQLAVLMPDEPEVHGLQALLEIQASRTRARRGSDGEPILLEEQDRHRWDQLLIGRGLAALDRAEATGRAVGPYVLQAAIAACHARARRAEDTDWIRISELYDVISEAYPSPVVEVNRAVAHGRAHGPDAGLAILAAVATEPSLTATPLVESVRGDLLERRGDREGAAAAFQEAAGLTRNEAERRLLLRRAEGGVEIPARAST